MLTSVCVCVRACVCVCVCVFVAMLARVCAWPCRSSGSAEMVSVSSLVSHKLTRV